MKNNKKIKLLCYTFFSCFIVFIFNACGTDDSGTNDVINTEIEIQDNTQEGLDIVTGDDGSIDINKDYGPEMTPPPAKCVEASDKGVVWLASKQNPDHSWGETYQFATTAFVVLKLEIYAKEK